METTRLSSKGQIIIPKGLRKTYSWQAGVIFDVIDTGNGILLKPKSSFPQTTVAEVAGCLAYEGEAKSIEEMDEAIQRGLEETWHDRS